jgi:hypothetical protein
MFMRLALKVVMQNDGDFLDEILLYHVGQRFSNFFKVGTTFISHNVLRTLLLLSPLKASLIIFLMFSPYLYVNTSILILLK